MGMIDCLLNDKVELESTTIQKAVIEILKLKQKEADDYQGMIKSILMKVKTASHSVIKTEASMF